MITRYLSRIRSFFRTKRRASTSFRRSPRFRRWSLECETLENRCVPTAHAFLQGFTFLDLNHNGQFDSGEGQANNTLQLFAADLATAHLYSPSADLTTVLGTTTSNSIGYYIFSDSNVLTNNLRPGNYRIVETPVAGFTNNDVDLHSTQVYPSSRVSASTIQVTLVDPSQLLDHFHGFGPGAQDTPILNGTPLPGFTGQLLVNLSSKGFTTPNFFTFCLDLTQTVGGGVTFPVQPGPMSTAFPNGAEIAFLYNHFGTITLSNTDAEALQQAEWELIYGAAFTPDLSHPGVAAAYNNFLSLANGAAEDAIFLHAVNPLPRHGQSMIATGSLNFSNIATPTIVTMASETGGGVVGTAMLNDSAVLAGTFMGTGTITFTLTQPDGTTITVGTDTVVGDGTYVAPSVLATQVGTYTWHASYSGDSLNNGAIDNGNNESLTTVKTSPTIVTMASETGGGVVGTAMLNDSAVLAGTFMGTGTITFTLTQPDGTTITVGTDTVAGDGTYVAPSVLATQVGTYTWHASYSGDSLNNGAIDNGNNESLTTVKTSPTIVTMASETGGGVVGTAMLNDSAVLAGTFMGTGTITFTLTQPDGTTITVGTDTVAGDGTYVAPSVLATQVGTYTWHASYSGDSLNNGAIDNGNNESLTTVKTTPTIVTMASETGGGVVGTAMLNDSAVLTGTFMGTGTITFTLTQPDGTTITVGTDTVAGEGTYVAPSVLATQVGTYTWHASYSGDGLNNGAIDNGNNESLTTVKTSPTIVTMASETGGGVVGTAMLNDSAVLAGTFMGTGTITFTLTQPDGATITVGTDTVAGNGTYVAPSVLATQFGTYTWHASYSGDGLNNGAIDNGNNESLTTVKTSPTIVTMASETGGGVVGTVMLNDSAVLAGTFMGTGTITFTLTQPDGTTITVGTDTVAGNGTYVAPSVLATQVGTYTWHASYSGDSLNNGAIDNGNNESLTTVKTSPTIVTMASETGGGVVGTAMLNDSAVLTGTFMGTGTITFTLTQPDGSTITVGTVTVVGNGTYVAPSVLATQVGTYTWHASYSGDSLNNGAIDNGTNESLSITNRTTPTITTVAGPTVVLGSGNRLTDSATLSGGVNPTGTITFTLHSPSNMIVDTETVTVHGNGTYTTPLGFLPTAVGTYQWVASYSGDANNNPVSSALGDEPQTVTSSMIPIGKIDLLGSNFSGSTDGNITENIQFVNSIYHNLLARAPDQTGLTNWFIFLEAGGSRFQVAQTIWQSPEHRDLEVEQYYETILHRLATPAERAGWVGLFLAGATETQIEFDFLNSSEYLAAHASATSFVTGLYTDVLGRNPSSNELSVWQQALATGLSRSSMDQLFLSSTEFDVRILDGFYSQFLNRAPDAAGQQGWLGFLRSGGSIEAVAESFLASTEYYQSAH
jgi:hypothetical protein